MLASRASERSYSASIADSAWAISRSANQTVATIMKHAETTTSTNDKLCSHGG
nr:hypothetical protein CPGR_05716 [Mycolicibacter nonchromogenicus]